MIQIFEQHPHWPFVLETLSKIQSAGYQALLAGGCVRDALLGTLPKDFDIATQAHPEELEKLFPKSIEVGKQFGVLILPFSDFQLEIATFREEGEYLDGRRPSEVQYSTAEKDAQRRDFTVNALFYDPLSGRILDYVGGQNDLKKRLLKTVGEPEKRFQEDKLRILRALRFTVQLEFKLEVKTAQKVKELVPELKVVSKERQRDEFSKMLSVPNRARGLDLLNEYRVWPVLCSRYAEFVSEQESSPSKELWNAGHMLLSGLPDALNNELDLWTLWLLPYFVWRKNRLQDEATSLKDVDDLLTEFKHSRAFIQGVKETLSRFAVFLRVKDVRDGVLMDLLLSEEGRRAHRVYQWAESVEYLKRLSPDSQPAQWREQKMNQLGWNWQRPTPLITGADLMAAGVSPGPDLGRLLQELWYLQLENPTADKSSLLKLASKSSSN